MWLKTITYILILVSAISLLMLGLIQDQVNAEEFLKTRSISVGQESNLSTLINNEFKPANYYTVDFNASNLSSGTYFYTIKAGSNLETKKMVLVK